MFTKTSLIATALAASAAMASPVQERQTGFCTGTDYPCTTGVLVLAARGTDVNYGFNDPYAMNPAYDQFPPGLENLAINVTNQAGGGSYCRALPYSAAPLANYFKGVDHGVQVGQGIIRDYVGRCGADSRIVLLGYSQGGQVMTSVLIGDTGRPNLDDLQQYITAGAFIASPSFVANVEPIDGGDSPDSGAWPRSAEDYARFNEQYGDRVRNYCQAGDQFCAGKILTGDDIHAAAPETFREEAQEFLAAFI